MRDDRTAKLLHLVDELQTQYGPHPTGRQALLAWLALQLDAQPADAGLGQILVDYPAHRASLLGDTHSTN